jgi:hypothetical protein
LSRFIQADDSTVPYSERRQVDLQAERDREDADTYIPPEDAAEKGVTRPVDDAPSLTELRDAVRGRPRGIYNIRRSAE